MVLLHSFFVSLSKEQRDQNHVHRLFLFVCLFFGMYLQRIEATIS